MNQAYPTTDLHEKIMGAVSAIETVIVGKHNEIVLLMTALLAGAHVLIEDVPGTGKTSLAAALSRVTGLDFNRAQFTPDVMASDITGFNIYNRQKETFEFREGLVMCNLLLADEINRASPKTQSALLEAMEESRVTVDGVTYDVPDPFMVIATQNPVESMGTFPLPEAQMDRFLMKGTMDYPTHEESIDILSRFDRQNPLSTLENVVSMEELGEAIRELPNIYICRELMGYISALVEATRTYPRVTLGVSPRGAIALMKAAKGYAAIAGRNYVLPDDIKRAAHPVMEHRLQLENSLRIRKNAAAEIIDDILGRTTVPTEAVFEARA